MSEEERQARIEEMQGELARVRVAMDEALDASRVAADGRSLSRQAYETLERREAHLSWDIARLATDTPFGAPVYARIGGGRPEARR